MIPIKTKDPTGIEIVIQYVVESLSWSTGSIYRRFPKTLDGLKRAIEHLEEGYLVLKKL